MTNPMFRFPFSILNAQSHVKWNMEKGTWNMKKFSTDRVYSAFFRINREKAMNKIEIENRLIDFSVKVVECISQLEKRSENLHLKDQAIRSCTASALNYGEAQSAESRKDFVHKLGIVSKELRETGINLKILKRLNPDQQQGSFTALLKENDELLAIFHKTIQTARQNS
jgi:four helix bundle protein